MERQIDSIDDNKPLPACQDKNAAVRWPLPIDYRLDQLVERSAEVGERTTRKELLASLVLAAPDDPEELSRIVRRFRMSKASDAVLRDEIERDGNVLKFPRHKPGPR